MFDRGADAALRFFEASTTTDDFEALAVEVGLACERWLGKQGFVGQADDHVEDDDDTQGEPSVGDRREPRDGDL